MLKMFPPILMVCRTAYLEYRQWGIGEYSGSTPAITQAAPMGKE